MPTEEMKAGRELDALVAEKVMGLPGIGHYGPTKSSGRHLDFKRFDSHEEAIEQYKKFWPEGSKRGHASWRNIDETLRWWQKDWGPRIIDDYSTCIMDAWEVVEKLEPEFRLTLVRAGSKWCGYLARGDWERVAFGESDAAAHAICLAALEATKNA